MKSMSQIKRTKKGKVNWLPIVLVLLLAGGGFGYFYWIQQTAAPVQAEDTSFKTTQVRQGSLTISASGSGTLIAGQESALSFSTPGTVVRLEVQVGDVVEQGQVLAELDNLDELQLSINTAQQELITAQKELATLKQNGPANLANAQLALVDAQKAVLDAKGGVVQEDWARCEQETIDAYYYQYTHAKDYLDSLGDGGGNADYYLKTIVPAKNTVAQAFAAYEYCTGFTEYEVTASNATLSLAEAEMIHAQAALDTLAENNGIDPIDLATADNKISNAQLAVDQAKAMLEGATLKAPFDGTILTVAGSLGDTAGTSAFITIADLAHPQVQFSVDETDMDKVAIGEQATVSFDAVPGRTFKGTVIRINPALESSGGYQVVTGLIQLDLSQETDVPTLVKGLNGSVELIQATAENVLVVPLQAIRDLGDGSYAVFVVSDGGQPKMKVVEVGLQDAASAEIKSGLSIGDVVTTGIAETK